MHHDDSSLFSHKHPEHEFGAPPQEGDQRQADSARQTYGRVAYGLVAALVFLLPLFFIPLPGFPVGLAKTILFASLGLLTSVFVFLGAGDRPASGLPAVFSVVLLGLFTAFMLSTLFSMSPWMSLIGEELSYDSLIVLTALVLFSLSVPLVVNTKKRAFFILVALFGSGALLVLFHVIRFFVGASVLSFNIFASIESTAAGSWHELGLFAGLLIVAATVLTMFSVLTREMKIGVWTVAGLATVLVVAVNFNLVYLTLAGVFLLLAVYAFIGSDGKQVPFSHYALPLAFVGLFLGCFFLSGTIGDVALERFGSSYSGVRPTWTTTFDVARSAWSSPKEVLVGTGPHTFSYVWEDHRPYAVVQSAFWNASFSAGSSTLLTMAITTGLVGLLALLGVVGYLVWRAFVFVVAPPEHQLVRALLAVSLVGSIYLAVVLSAFVVSSFLFVLTFFFLAFMTAIETQAGRLRLLTQSGGEAGVLPMLGRGAGVIALIVLVPFLSITVARSLYASSVYTLMGQGETGPTVEEIAEAEGQIMLATRFERNDDYGKLLVDLRLARLRELVARFEEEEITEDQFVAEFNQLQAGLTSAVGSALEIDSRNYANWIKAGNIYESFGALGMEGAYEVAAQRYAQAKQEHPTSPEIPLIEARFAALRGELEEAETYAREAIEMKPNYADAHLYLASLAFEGGGSADAIEVLDEAIALAPGNPLLYYEKGLLHYSEEEYDIATEAFANALQLDQTSQNARYQLALSLYYGSGSDEDALTILGQLQEANPENEQLDQVVSNIENGNDPFEGIEGAQQVETEDSEVQQPPSTNTDTNTDTATTTDGDDEAEAEAGDSGEPEDSTIGDVTPDTDPLDGSVETQEQEME